MGDHDRVMLGPKIQYGNGRSCAEVVIDGRDAPCMALRFMGLGVPPFLMFCLIIC